MLDMQLQNTFFHFQQLFSTSNNTSYATNSVWGENGLKVIVRMCAVFDSYITKRRLSSSVVAFLNRYNQSRKVTFAYQ